MKSYTIHEKPDPPLERLDRSEALEFVKDGFSIFAFAVPPIWMIANRLWLVLFLYAVTYAAIELVISLTGAPTSLRGPVILGLSLLIGFEADSLRRWTLERRGWTLVGTVTGENEAVCQRRFFEQWVPRTPAIAGENLGRASAGSDSTIDPFQSVTSVPETSSLGPVQEPRRRTFIGKWRTKDA